MFTLRKLCLVVSNQRCIDSDELEAEAKISDMTVSANLSHLPYESKYAGLQEPVPGVILPRLVLSIQETAGMDPATVFQILPAGVKDSSRFGSGVTYGGSSSECEIQLAPTERGVGRHHFQIAFQSSQQRYTLKDLGEGTGTFLKLTFPHRLALPCIVSFGESHMKVTVLEEEALQIVFLEGPKKDVTLYDSFSNFTPADSPVKVGRMASATIRFDDSSLSRCQCSLLHQEGTGWTVQDGDGSKLSTNGTWLFAEFPCDLQHGAVFKAAETLFKVTVELEESVKE